MPPKSKKNEPGKKAEQKKKEKIIEDKTFGLKNKKGGKQQKYIQTVAKQVQYGNKSAREMEKLQQEKLSKKEQKKKELEELTAIFKPVEQKIGKGADPKSVLCAFFKQGLCTKGDKCKFSHDLSIGRKAEKRSVYEEENSKETMENWDESKLEEVVNQKHGEKNKSLPKTTIICKYFLDAVENSKYGWFWNCPNGETCHYRHALPPGFVLKKDKKKLDELKEDQISLEELIEKERAALCSKNLTKVTLESFLKWKDRKRKEKIDKIKADADKKKQDYKAGRIIGISGREMFEFNPDLIAGDDDEASTEQYRPEPEEDEEDGPVREVTIEALSAEAREVDNSGTVAPPATQKREARPSVQNSKNHMVNDTESDEKDKLAMAAALAPSGVENGEDPGADGAAVTPAGGETIDEPIDENLFAGEDLDLVEEELETLDLVD